MTSVWGYRDRMPKNGERDGAYIFVKAEADRGLSFFDRRLYIPEGDLAGSRYRKPPWQDRYVSALYGWRRMVPSVSVAGRPIARSPLRLPRRYRRSLVAIPRGNLKSSLGAGICLKGLVGDRAIVPKIVGAGTDRYNAAIIFGYSAFSARRDPELRRRLEIFDGTKVIRRRGHEGDYRVISAKDTHAHGGHPTLILVDDLQAQPHPKLLSVLRTSQVTLSDSLFVAMMTAGLEKAGVGWEYWDRGLAIEADPSLSPEYLVAMYYLSDSDDWTDPASWRKANPSLGFSIREEEIRDLVKEATDDPTKRPDILALNFNVWPGGAVASWIPAEVWKGCALAVDPEDLRGRECAAAIVATSSTDVASVAYVFPPDDEHEGYDLWVDAFVPEDRIRQLEAEYEISFGPFLASGVLSATPGNTINGDAIVRSILRRRDERWRISQIAWNPRGPAGIANDLEEEGLEVVDVTPGFSSLSAAMRELERLALSRELRHGGNPLLAWQVRNLRAKRNGLGDLAPDGEKSSGNITGSLAAVMALGRLIAGSGDSISLEAS